MRRSLILGILLLDACSCLVHAQTEDRARSAQTPAQPSTGGQAPVLIPFDFESRFDQGRYGQIIGDLLWAKLRKQAGVILPESMQDVRDWCERRGVLPNPDTQLEAMSRYVRDEQAGDLAIWGKVERVAGEATDVYDLWIKIADFRVKPPLMLFDQKVRTQTVSEIPHTFLAQALQSLPGAKATLVASKDQDSPPDPRLDARFKKFSSLIPGDFEQGADHPTGWDPLPPHVAWMMPGKPDRATRTIRFNLPPAVAESTGVLYYSDFFPIDAGATYRFACRWKSSAPAVKVFIKAYAEFPSKMTDATGKPLNIERREVYRSQQNLTGRLGSWNRHAEDFTPKHARFQPRWARVMLYAYYPAGAVEWDDIQVKEVEPAASPPLPSPREP